MSIAQWDDSYKSGHQAVDIQHETLFAMVNALHDAIMAGKGNNALAPNLQKLAKYTIDHFAEEERLMTSIAFPGFLAHRAKHLELTRQVEDLLAKFHEGKLVLSMTISTFLTNWLKHHMQEDDVTLIQYLKAHPATRTLSAAAR